MKALFLKIMIGLPMGIMALLMIVQSPKLWAHTGHRPDVFGLALLQGGLPLLPYGFFAIALWFAADTIARFRPHTPREPVLCKGLGRSGAGLMLGGLAIGLNATPWVWGEVYNNTGRQPGVTNDVLLTLTFVALGLILLGLSQRIRALQTAREALSAELEQYV
ncbi:hypothetical protein [Asticcacaulis currens]|uniref:DUF2975 domain-containing protein n=1 Tax=Asticcacaulis currens TaxID=2984210 RepID=A0ABT5IGW2_9CAUL|nr:hypothetical protein [Asticcacaulis currens]MDC7695445.1 hypothetical protein [Asticcacaulis currens]